MSLLPITDGAEARRAFDAFRGRFSQGAQLFQDHWVGHRGATRRYDVYWHPAEGIWGLFDDRQDRGRFWICFGIEDPETTSSLTITVEVNPPFSGVNRYCAGIFLRDEGGNIHIAHSGKVGGGRKGIGQEAFRQFVQDYVWEEVSWPDGRSGTYKVIGGLDESDLPSKVADFVHDVARFKDWAVSSGSAVPASRDVSSGRSTTEGPSQSVSPKYEKLFDYLVGLEKFEWRATFEEIEEILERRLPKSARLYPAWWSNGGHLSQTSPWINAGWRTSDLNLSGETIRFQRVKPRLGIGQSAPAAAASPPEARPAARTKAGSPSAPPTDEAEPDVVCAVRFAWTPVGAVSLDKDGRLEFPSVTEQPGLYRFSLSTHGDLQVYFGETDNLRRRFHLYRNAGPSQQTNIRLHRLFVERLRQGWQIAVATIVKTAWISTHGDERQADLTSKAERIFIEHAAIVRARSEGTELLNR
jgi:hypothetical protein